MDVKETFRTYLSEAIGSDNALVAFSAFESPASVSVRLNPYKPSGNVSGKTVEWNPHGRILSQRPSFTLDPAFHAGAYYVQDSSSMFVGHVFRRMLENMELPQERPVRVLDLCAAPGGKTTDIAASLREKFGDRFLLVANEVMKARVGVLAENVARWGDPNVVVTGNDPRDFAALRGFFDVIVADVPCSGEGMFRKDEQARELWSEDNVALCVARQRRIVADVWPALAEGGVFVYSTCTFNRYENDGNVKWIAEELGGSVCRDDMSCGGALRTECGYSLVPGFVEGEGQFCAALVKESEDSWTECRQDSRRGAAPEDAVLKGLFSCEVVLRPVRDMITAVPAVIYGYVSLLEKKLHVVAAGCAAGVRKGKTFVPDADLALSLMLSDSAYPSVEIDRKTALEFLHRDAVVLTGAPSGYIIVRYAGLPLGFVKNLGTRCNNLYPQSRRIRMEIK